jgi:hypothetical protein
MKGGKAMGIHVKKGTPLHGESLCTTCTHAHIVKGYRESEEVVVCQATYPEQRIAFPVRECSGYIERKRQTLRQMEDIAWVLVPRGSKRRAGFVSAGELRGDENEIELILNDQE